MISGVYIMKSKILSSLTAVLLGLMLVFLLVFSDEATDAARNALHISSVSVIPSLFTYIVLCGVITKLDLLSPLGRLIPAEKLFGLPECTSPVILMGLVCGFPVGASCTADLYSVGAISKSDAQRLAAISSCASPAFLVSSVGFWWGDKRFGTALYICSVLTVLLYGVFTRKHGISKNNTTSTVQKEKIPIAEAVCSSVSSAALSSLNITAYITFFSVIRALLVKLLPSQRLIISALLEFSSGAYTGALSGGYAGAAVTGFAVGFASLSVFMQTLFFTSRVGIGMKHFFFSKLICGFTSALTALLYFHFFPMEGCAKDVFYSVSSLNDVISAIFVPTILYISCIFVSKINKFCVKS